jgi:hypothetical protein
MKLQLFIVGYLSGTAVGYGLDDRGFESRHGLGIFIFTVASRPAVVGHAASYQMGTRGLFPGGVW